MKIKTGADGGAGEGAGDGGGGGGGDGSGDGGGEGRGEGGGGDADFCKKNILVYYRGSSKDELERYYQFAK